ncbi:NosD domain-containing protein [Paenibacillus albus]|uniref:Periplasmic copper-binding protein NosD beta helix domain-containing protein n=1 Tax=Paenibacillus albus TaxID=2495582 RepID=A0A3Q8X8R2_9BACL|nr:right-handed parallel beta-helix repeat-containing protein [Paenibacillus albus]AZN42929.1 hypothetical protein EJC50_26955 [Paenibacillus albus]
MQTVSVTSTQLKSAIDSAIAANKPLSVSIDGGEIYVFDGVELGKIVVQAPTPPDPPDPPTTGFRPENYGGTNAVAINKAISAASSAKGTVVFTAGTAYTGDVNTPIKVLSDVTMKGNGATLKLTGSGFAADFVQIAGNNTVIDGLVMDGNNLTIHGLTVGTGVTNTVIKNNTVKNVTQGGNYSTDLVAGIFVRTGVDTLTIDSNEVANVAAKNAPAISRGIAVSTYGGTVAKHVTISNNYVHDITPKDDGDGIWFDNSAVESTGSIIIGNKTERTAKRGIKVQSAGVTIKNNTIINSYLNNNTYVASNPVSQDMYSGISVYADNLTIQGNIIQGVGSFYCGIEIGSDTTLKNIVISGNSVSMGPTANVSGATGVRIGNINGFQVTSNTIKTADSGVWTWQSAANGTLTGNTISDVNYGINFSTYLTGQTFTNVTQGGNTITAKKQAVVNR